MQDVKTTTLQNYSKKYGSDKAADLYVVNQSDGRICFNNKDSQGISTVIVPVSFAPLDLTSICERDSLIVNPHFRRMLSNRHLVIIDNDDLERVLKEDDELREEFNQINNTLNDEESTVSIDMGRDKAAENRESHVADNEDPCSNPALSSIIKECELLDNDSDGEKLKSLKQTLRNKMRQFSKEELEEFIKVCPNQSLRDMATSRVNQLEEK